MTQQITPAEVTMIRALIPVCDVQIGGEIIALIDNTACCQATRLSAYLRKTVNEVVEMNQSDAEGLEHDGPKFEEWSNHDVWFGLLGAFSALRISGGISERSREFFERVTQSLLLIAAGRSCKPEDLEQWKLHELN